jgi:hypothetical protein
MYFNTKNYLKSTRNHTAKHAKVSLEKTILSWTTSSLISSVRVKVSVQFSDSQ